MHARQAAFALRKARGALCACLNACGPISERTLVVQVERGKDAKVVFCVDVLALEERKGERDGIRRGHRHAAIKAFLCASVSAR